MTGHSIGNRYEVGELLGRGGMAEVRKGTDTRLGRVVAIKKLRTDLASDSTFQARFRREAQSSASLNHPAIVAVYDTGEELATDGSGVNQPYIVMEYVAGRTLREILREGRKILPERALELTSGVLAALDYSHRAGIIHRDIKPGNVMLTPSGDVKVMDFGIARAISDASSSMTQTAAVVGTAQYLSPEQARGETVDSRSDVYSAGCLLYELLTGQPPFTGDSPVAVAYQHVREPVIPPSHHDTELPPAIDAIVLKSLAKPLDERYQSAAAMRSDIEAYLAGRPVAAPVPVATPEPAPDTSATRVVPVQTASTPAPSPASHYDDRNSDSRAAMWVVLGLLLVGLIAAAFFLWPKLFPDSPEQVSVPDVIGQSETRARAAIGDAGFEIGNIERRADEAVDAGDVIEQTPSGEDFADPGASIDLVISLGKPEKPVPSIVGLDKAAAAQQLRDDGFKPNGTEAESDLPKGQVITQSPTSNTMAQDGATVAYEFSDGPEKVPDVVGLKQGDAEKAMSDAGFVPKIGESNSTTELKGTVIQQIPGSGGTLPQGSEVTIVVSSYVEPPPTTTTPPIPTTPIPTTPIIPPPPVATRAAG